jgi:hypothetical protein
MATQITLTTREPIDWLMSCPRAGSLPYMPRIMGAPGVPYTNIESKVVIRKEANETSNNPTNTRTNKAPGRRSRHDYRLATRLKRSVSAMPATQTPPHRAAALLHGSEAKSRLGCRI